MIEQSVNDVQPPRPPEITRRLQLPALQVIGVPILALLPLLAVVGMFDERWTNGEAIGGSVRASVEYPSRFRARLTRPITVRVENRSGGTLGLVDVVFEPAYLDRFAHVMIAPSPREAYVVSFAAIPAGETRTVHVTLEGESFGRHEGRVIVRAHGESVAVPVKTFVLP